MNVTIFSKDRACQLELLLRSIKDLTNIGRVNVIYTASDKSFHSGYDKIFALLPYECYWILEENFKEQLISSINPDDKYTMFLTDDAVFKSKFDVDKIDDVFTDDMAAFSLMLGKNINYAYEEERDVKQPSGTIWNWKGSDIDFDYPMSVIGHIWKTADVIDKIRNLNYDQAYNVECALKDNPINKPFMSCYPESKVVHIANNVVSPMGNKSGGQSVKELNDRFLKGDRIKWEKINNNSVHFEWEYKFERME